MTEISPEESPGASGSPTGWPISAREVPSARGRGAVATTDEAATQVAVEVLERGGSAVDAAVAAAFALAVVNPEAGGVGGSGYLLVRTPVGAVHALDFRSTAPGGAASSLRLQSALGRGDAGLLGHLAVAVPGVVAGLEEAHSRFGTLTWKELLEPSIELARGFVVRERLTRSYTSAMVDKLRQFNSAAEIFLPGGSPPSPGEVFRQPDLAATLERIRDGGAADFYQGFTAEKIVAGSRRGGGVLALDDMVRYRAIWRHPVRVRYRNRTIISTPPSSSGGVVLALLSGIVGQFDLAPDSREEAGRFHILIEAYKRAFADRNQYLGDPAFSEIPLRQLLDPGYAAQLAESIGSIATPSSEISPGLTGYREGAHTTHLSVVDEAGGAVSLTLTLNTWYGSGVVAEGTGILLNCDMDDFTLAPEAPNYFGLVQGAANRIATGKRMLSAMAPTMVLDFRNPGELLYVLGTPGGATIPTTTFQILSHLFDRGLTPAEAIAAPRIHHQHLPDQVEYEPGGMDVELGAALQGMGHPLHERDEFIGDVQMVVVEGDGTKVGYSDPRRGGRPGAY